MKKILATILAAALAGGLGGTAWGDDNFYQDSGNASLWHIANLDGLIAFRQSVNNKTTYSGKTIQLDADIDMTGISWLPIGGGTTEDTDTSETWQNYYFAGTFDGKSHVISNLKVTLTKEDSRMSNRVGLFGFVNGGTVKDLVIANVDLTGGWHVAPVAGRGVNATFSGITVRGTVNVDAVGYASGLVANAYTGNVRDCVVNGTLNISGADGDTGGIAGGGYANISDCVVVGVGDSVISGGEFTGGIKGYSGEGDVKVEGCSVSNVTVAATSCGAGGVFGGLQYGNCIIDCNVYDVTVVGNNPINSGVIGLIAGSSLGTESSPCFIYGCSVSNSTATVDGVQTFSLCGDKNWDGESNGNGYVYFNSDKTSTVNDNTVALTSGTYSASPESVVAGKTAVSVSYTAKSYVAEGISVADNSNGTWTIGTPSPVASPVTFGVRSDNLFGSIKIEGNVASNMYVAVPFEGFEADGALRKAQDVVHATNLTAGTKMYVYDKTADKYDVYEVDANGKWAAALKINVTEMTNTFDTADLMRGVTNGTGVIVGRKNTAETVYVYGQVPKIPIASTTFGAGQTLVSPPYTNGVEYVDLNASTWTGVSATTKKRLKGQAGADYIQFRAPNNKLVKYYYLEGEGWGVVPTQVSLFSEFVANGKALIPVGTAFWYYSNAGGAKVEWK